MAEQCPVRLAQWWNHLRADRLEERGATMVEYAMLVALIAVVCIASIDFLGDAAADKFAKVGSSIGQP